MCSQDIQVCVWVCAQFAYTVMSAQYAPYIQMCVYVCIVKSSTLSISLPSFEISIIDNVEDLLNSGGHS